MNLEDLRAVQAEERSTDSLRSLRDSFYREVAAYIEERRAERDGLAEDVDDPFGSEDVRRLTDEIETAEEVVEAIYERRVGKLVKRASLVASGMTAGEEGLTAEESALFSDLVAAIESNRREVLASIDGDPGSRTEGDAAETGDPADGDPGDDAGAGAADPAGTPPDVDGTPDPPDPVSDDGETDVPAEPDTGPDRVTLRVTRDVGEIYGVDERTYDLAAEDVVTLPAPNADPLIESDAAERLE